MKYRESQSNFFGKRGISWHIAVVSRTIKDETDGGSAPDDSDTDSVEGSGAQDDVLDDTVIEESDGDDEKLGEVSDSSTRCMII